MLGRTLLCVLLCLGATVLIAQDKDKKTPSIQEKIEGLPSYEGFFTFYWNEKEGKIYLEVDRWEEEFLYVNSLTAGVGSNDIGLDRNQLGDNRIVQFVRSGPKVLLLQINYNFRANSDNPDERQAVREAFAQSVLHGFKAEAITDDRVLIDLTPMLMHDAHGVADRLKARKQGKYAVDKARSMVYLDRTKSFPLNSEFEALLTFKGSPEGSMIRSVVPTPDAITVRQHHSFVQLPDDNYEPRPFDPRSGYFPLAYQDYATPIDQPLVKRFIRRHRLQKKDPSAERSEAVEPIIYYLDRGAPEPIRSALLEGARWWNEAFEAAGFINAFQVEILPEGADPLDVRYNMINWVHRSTRGWSYGSSVTDPRTGEIIKGHVLLGSLRVRQDFLIAQGLVEAYANGDEPDPRLVELALARLRQLSAHEVGHTLGLSHNFAASTYGRASVMDYPHPQFSLTDEGDIDFSAAYDTGIGEWDKAAIRYGYSQFAPDTDQQMALRELLAQNERDGLAFISDADARPLGSAHPDAHLWDNGANPVDELDRMLELRAVAMDRFSEKNIAAGRPMAELETVLVPLYLMHRYQIEAAAKVIGGQEYTYAVRGGQTPPVGPVAASKQEAAIDGLLRALQPEALMVPAAIQSLIPPPPIGYSRNRESFKTYTGGTFDPLAMAASASDRVLQLLLHPDRLSRIVSQHAFFGDTYPTAVQYLITLSSGIRNQVKASDTPYSEAVAEIVEKRYLLHLLRLAKMEQIDPQVRAAVLKAVQLFRQQIPGDSQLNSGHVVFLQQQLDLFERNPELLKVPAVPDLPDGSPIGCY